ncbi:MAG: hypothetical protein Q8N63_08680 [Nanoarchaeota archaeon]|nr:hypothetical protein [Nanoarchaeota archaeon]
MATITLNINDKVNEEFRQTVKSKLGEGKGILGKAIEEAIKKWIFEQKQKEIAERQIKIMKEGVWSLKNYRFDREEIYEKRGSISC